MLRVVVRNVSEPAARLGYSVFSLAGIRVGNYFYNKNTPIIQYYLLNKTQWVPGDSLGALSSRVKYLGREVDHSPPSISDVSIEWSCATTLPYAFVAFTRTARTSSVWKQNLRKAERQ